MASSVKVAVRVRPLNQRESKVIVSMSGNQTSLETNKYSKLENSHIPVSDKTSYKRFVYDYSYWSVARNDKHFVSQEKVFEDLGTLVLDAAFEGYNACVFAYGQTGAGKTYTMMGTQGDPGLIPRICEGLYKHASVNSNDQESFRIDVSYLEIYNEQVLDLLRSPGQKERDILSTKLRVREHPKDGPYVQGLTKHDAPDYTTIESLLSQGNQLRKTAATKMNDHSSRSHAIFTIKYTQAKFVAGLPSEITSKINLVDLAGSERAAKSGATGDRLKEGGNINRSLTTLGSVISALAEKSSRQDTRKIFVPYRDSVLTWLLKDSLGGNSKTIMIAAIAPAECSYGETLSTLRYAERAKNIINVPTVNEDPNVKLIRELKAEIERLKSIIDGDHSLMQQNVDEAQKLLEGTESKMERHLRDWAEKWRDTLLIMEESDLGLYKHRSTLRIDMDPPHLVLLDDDPLNTSITIFSLNEGENLIGNINADEELDLVFHNESIQNQHCVVMYDGTSTVMLKPLNGYCQINDKVVQDKPMKLSQGDVILLGHDIRLKFNYPQEACFLREKRRSGQFSRSMDKSLHLLSPVQRLEEVTFTDQPLSPESGVEIDAIEDTNSETNGVDKLRQQVEDLLVKYKESEIARLDLESRNKLELEAKDKEIDRQTIQLLQRQKSDEVLLEQYQKELQDLREELCEEKTSVRSELVEQLERLFAMMNSKDDDVEASKKDIEKKRRKIHKQLKREWSKLDQYEMKLIEVEAEKRKIIEDAERKLKQERAKSDAERQRQLDEVEKERKHLQEMLENHLTQREDAKKDYEQIQRKHERCSTNLEENLEIFLQKLTKLEWLEYRICRDEVECEDEISEIMLKIKTATGDLEILDKQNEKNKEKFRKSERELEEKQEMLECRETKVEQSLKEIAAVREQLVECQQHFGEQLGDIVNIVSLERDANLVKIEKDREILMSKHLEHQSALEVLVNETLESSDEEECLEIKEIQSRVVDLVRSASPGLDDESLQSQIIGKKVQIHYQQEELGKSDKEKKIVEAHQHQFLAVSEQLQKDREKDQKLLQQKINALHAIVSDEDIRETVNYYDSESTSLMKAQKHIADVNKELASKMRERRETEGKLEHVKRQMEVQVESNQEGFRDMMETLRHRCAQLDSEIAQIKKMLQSEVEEYLKRLRTENFTVLEKPENNDDSSYGIVADGVIDEMLREIELASHVPELAKSHDEMKQDCGGWSYEGREKDVHFLRKENKSEAIHSFLGCGIIRTEPRTVLQTVSTPPSRFVYDRMLKNIRIVEKIKDNLTVVYMLHETSRCFFKTSRDFCFASRSQEKDGKQILACKSVEHPNCPEVKGIQRGKIVSSGWVIEPITIKDQPCSLVWYLTQVNLGRSIPSKLVNLVSKRQPMSVAYLREYLVTE